MIDTPTIALVIGGATTVCACILDGFSIARLRRRVHALEADVARLNRCLVTPPPGTGFMFGAPGCSLRITAAVERSERDEAIAVERDLSWARLVAELPETQLYRREGRKFVRAGNIDQPHNGSNAS